MMNMMMSAVASPLPAFARAAVFAVLAIAAVGVAELYQHHVAAGPVASEATTIDAAQPLAPAPSAVDMWRV